MAYKIQIDDLVRDATPEEQKFIETMQNQPNLNDRAKATDLLKQSAREKLKALGLTEAEIAVLVG